MYRFTRRARIDRYRIAAGLQAGRGYDEGDRAKHSHDRARQAVESGEAMPPSNDFARVRPGLGATTGIIRREGH